MDDCADAPLCGACFSRPMSLVHNEQRKLTATYLNGLAIALFAVGGLAPIFSFAFGSAAGQPFWTVLIAAAICIFVSGILHLVARRSLKGLIP